MRPGGLGTAALELLPLASAPLTPQGSARFTSALHLLQENACLATVLAELPLAEKKSFELNQALDLCSQRFGHMLRSMMLRNEIAAAASKSQQRKIELADGFKVKGREMPSALSCHLAVLRNAAWVRVGRWL